MKKPKEKKIKLSDFDIFNERAAQGHEVARAIDEETAIPFSTTITAHSFEEFLSVLSPKRYELLKLSRSGKKSISELAKDANRDPSAVSKDIAKLMASGFVTVVEQSNAGHGIKKIVRPVAENIEIRAAL
ncbi:ArsR family transcriptional regulator [Herbaspirillum frisingense]|uniref:HVO_A0114 family putative DNA-binding protein n=1 Tax=Herbaspirillum frisingense TaxID=92645 RepID=UPI0016035B2B|nr:ArsR family transcriptional regulator [Herbaspirillum frisingense]QNB06262.1 ArsR family transcriptional regulator [Herbaspirillum frisingense]